MKKYYCSDCGIELDGGEGSVFTCCEPCWDKHYKKTDEAESEVRVEAKVMPTNGKIKSAIKEILWMARRYADGRQTFAATSFNDAYDILRDIYGEDIEYNKIDQWIDTTLTEEGKYFPYAQDGGGRMFDCVLGRKYYKNDKSL